MRKPYNNSLFIVLLAVILLIGAIPLGECQEDTDVKGILNSDTTWTKADSPYRLIGPVAINAGVTLTIEPGVHVELGGYYLQVNGTLVARGNGDEPVSLLTAEGHPSELIFMPSSKSWDKQTGTGSIIEKAEIPSSYFKITVNGGSPKITSSISQARITVNSGSPQIDNCRFYGDASINVKNGAPIISHNSLSSVDIKVENGSPIITDNVITGNPTMMGDSLVGYSGTCIRASGGNPYIANNNISKCDVAIQVGEGTIKGNTISDSYRAIVVVGSSSPVISYNNILLSTENIVLSEGANRDIDASNNWWGTTDVAKIDRSIWDVSDDFNLGKVNYLPILTSPNPMAPSVSIVTATPAPTSNPAASATPTIQNPTATPTQTGAETGVLFSLDWRDLAIVLLSGAVVVLLVFVVFYLRRRSVAVAGQAFHVS